MLHDHRDIMNPGLAGALGHESDRTAPASSLATKHCFKSDLFQEWVDAMLQLQPYFNLRCDVEQCIGTFPNTVKAFHSMLPSHVSCYTSSSILQHETNQHLHKNTTRLWSTDMYARLAPRDAFPFLKVCRSSTGSTAGSVSSRSADISSSARNA